MMIWQLAREVWWYESRFPLSLVGYSLEPIYLRVYRDARVVTFSTSTTADLRSLGLRGDIATLPIGIDPVEIPDTTKGEEPTFVYVGRLAPSKRIDEIVQAFGYFYRTARRGRLLLIGNGDESYLRRLAKLVGHHDLTDRVEFCGWLQGSEKQGRMAAASALLMASAREGWGLVVTECSACGTPAVVYDVPGLRDSVRHMETGLVVPRDPRALADGMLQIVNDRGLYQRLREAGLKWSGTLTFEGATHALQERLEMVSSAGSGRNPIEAVKDGTSVT